MLKPLAAMNWGEYFADFLPPNNFPELTGQTICRISPKRAKRKLNHFD
jgi:hypothetical protein